MSALIGGSSSKVLRVKEFRSSGTYTVPAGVKTVELFMVGGGGGSNASAGGHPGQLVKTKYDVDGKASCAVVIGAGGAVNAVGGDTSFDGVVIAAGGKAGSLTASALIVGTDGFGGAPSNASSVAGANGAQKDAAGIANTGAGGWPAGSGYAGGSGYLRVEWYE